MALSEISVISQKRLLRTDYQLVPLVFAVALFVSALLLFSVQPLIAKMLLPYLGGTPAVWNTCMVFFQVMLLCGYVYSHILPRAIGISRHAILHLGLMIATAFFLPIAVSPTAIESLHSASSAPLWLLATLLTTVGLPFFTLSTSAPLLQSWFSNTSHRRASDPYFLYAASNLGSLLALLSYPLLIEPNLKLGQQSFVWTTGYGIGFALIVICAITFLRRRSTVTAATSEQTKEFESSAVSAVSAVSWPRRLKWIALAFVPSSLMLGVTTYVSVDLATIPLLWVIPLSLYLLTFILQFSRGAAHVRRWERFVLPLLALPVVSSLASVATQRPWFSVPMHLAFFFVAAMVCHGQLANDRPGSRQLTEFYLWLSVGGALGGLFNALVAPLLFRNVIEYPLMIVLACLLRPRKDRIGRWDFAAPIVVLALLCPVLMFLRRMEADWHLFLLTFTVSVLVAYSFVERPVKFGLAMLAVLVASTIFPSDPVKTLQAERNFFGVLRVISNERDTLRTFLHGTTIHGRQFVDPAKRCQPLGYYHREGPWGSIAASLAERPSARVAVIGLGAGGTAAYAAAGQEWTFYEIDPAVVRIARDRTLFSYLDSCAQAPIRYVVGDGRLRITEAASGYYNLIVLDAFSSDSIPLHLLTREAVGLYLEKLGEGGFLAFNISSRHFDLTPALGSIAKSYGLSALVLSDVNISPDEERRGKEPTAWVVMARAPEHLRLFTSDPRWQTLTAPEDFRVWTDDFSNIFSVLKR